MIVVRSRIKIKDFVYIFSKFYYFSLDFQLNVQNGDIIYFNLKIKQMSIIFMILEVNMLSVPFLNKMKNLKCWDHI